MTATFNLGDNYSVEEDSNGDLVITDSTGTSVLKHEDGADSISAVAPFDAIDADIGKLLKNLDANSQDINNIGALEATNLTLTPLAEATLTFASGETKGQIANVGNVSGYLIATVKPVDTASNNVRGTVDGIYYNSGDDAYRVSVSETLNDGGGDIKIVVWEVGA